MEEFAISMIIVLIIVLINVANWLFRETEVSEGATALVALLVYGIVYYLFALLIYWTGNSGINILPIF